MCTKLTHCAEQLMLVVRITRDLQTTSNNKKKPMTFLHLDLKRKEKKSTTSHFSVTSGSPTQLLTKQTLYWGNHLDPAYTPLPPKTYDYGPKMYFRVSWTQSHLFPGQPLGCTGVIALCARVPPCIQPVADWQQVINTSFKSLVHYCFVTQWPKCS